MVCGSAELSIRLMDASLTQLYASPPNAPVSRAFMEMKGLLLSVWEQLLCLGRLVRLKAHKGEYRWAEANMYRIAEHLG